MVVLVVVLLQCTEGLHNSALIYDVYVAVTILAATYLFYTLKTRRKLGFLKKHFVQTFW